MFVSLVFLPVASRPKAQAFDKLSVRELSRGYAEMLGRLFLSEPSLGLTPPSWLLRLLGLNPAELVRQEGPGAASIEAAERAAERDNVQVVAL